MTATRPSSVMTSEELDGEAGPGFGWLVFSACILGLAGIMRIIDAIWAFSYGGSLPEALEDGVLGSNLDNYAWTWLIVGIILLVAAGLLMSRNQLGRWVGIVAAAIGALSAMTWMPYYPVWSLTYVALAVLVFYGLVAHGRREA
jgi:hypothetical protein